MNKKFLAIASLVSVLVFGLLASGAYAMEHGNAKCGKGDIEDKLFCKAHLILENKEELGLSDEQVEKIKALKINAKKDTILKKAEIDIVALDIKAAMWKDPIDTAAVGKLLDKKYELKKEKAKSLIEAYAALKGTLTEEQKGKLKDIYKKCKKEMADGSMMKGEMKCPMMSGQR